MRLIARVQQVLEQHGVSTTPYSPTAIEFCLADHHGDFPGHILVDEECRAIYVRIVAPMTVPAEKRLRVAELLMRANLRIVHGDLEIDFRSGLVLCRTSTILGESDFHPDLLFHLLNSNWWEMMRWLPAIETVIFTGLSPRWAANIIDPEVLPEGADDEPDDAVWDHLDNIRHGSMN